MYLNVADCDFCIFLRKPQVNAQPQLAVFCRGYGMCNCTQFCGGSQVKLFAESPFAAAPVFVLVIADLERSLFRRRDIETGLITGSGGKLTDIAGKYSTLPRFRVGFRSSAGQGGGVAVTDNRAFTVPGSELAVIYRRCEVISSRRSLKLMYLNVADSDFCSCIRACEFKEHEQLSAFSVRSSSNLRNCTFCGRHGQITFFSKAFFIAIPKVRVSVIANIVGKFLSICLNIETDLIVFTCFQIAEVVDKQSLFPFVGYIFAGHGNGTAIAGNAAVTIPDAEGTAIAVLHGNSSFRGKIHSAGKALARPCLFDAEGLRGICGRRGGIRIVYVRNIRLTWLSENHLLNFEAAYRNCIIFSACLPGLEGDQKPAVRLRSEDVFNGRQRIGRKRKALARAVSLIVVHAVQRGAIQNLVF